MVAAMTMSEAVFDYGGNSNYYLDMLNYCYPTSVAVAAASSTVDSDGCSVQTEEDGCCSIMTEKCSCSDVATTTPTTTTTTTTGNRMKRVNFVKEEVTEMYTYTCTNTNNWHVSMSHVFDGLEMELQEEEEAREDREEDGRCNTTRVDYNTIDTEDSRRGYSSTIQLFSNRDIDTSGTRDEDDSAATILNEGREGGVSVSVVQHYRTESGSTKQRVGTNESYTKNIRTKRTKSKKLISETTKPNTITTSSDGNTRGEQPQMQKAVKITQRVRVSKKTKKKDDAATPSACDGTTRKRKQQQQCRSTTTVDDTTSSLSSSVGAVKQDCKTKKKEYSSWVVEEENNGILGRIVGLRLPSDVAPDFHNKNKLASHRRVNPNKYLALLEESSITTMTTTTTKPKVAAGRHGLKEIPQFTAATALLDIYLPTTITTAARNASVGMKNKTKIIRMIRNPNESVSATMRRLTMSVQKKIVGSNSTTMETRALKSKSKSKTNNAKCNSKPVLLKRRGMMNEGSSSSIVNPPSIAMQSTTTSFEENEEIACTTFWDRFTDILLPSANNSCNPWNNDDDSLYGSLCGGSMSQYDDDDDDGEMTNVLDGTDAAEGYERVASDHFNSLTIDEMLRRAAAATSKTDRDRFVLALPVSCRDGKHGHRATTKQHRLNFLLDSCPPTITSVTTFGSFEESHLFERTPIVVEVKSLYSTEVQIAWFVNDALVCSNSSWYIPTASDVGKMVTVAIVPKRYDHDGKGREEAYQFARCVEALPPLPVVSPLRDEFVPRCQEEREDGQPSSLLRVVTYNILADQNASRDVEKEDAADRSYSHCKNEHIIKWRRFPLIVHELLEYSPDIIALQEVDTDVYANLLRPVLSSQEYEGYYSQKGVDTNSGVREGCAIFWSLDVFESVRSVDMHTHNFRDLIRQFICEDRIHKSQWKSLSDTSNLLKKHDPLRHVLFQKLGHVLQTVVLTRKVNQEKVVVGNTHLFYHPMASHIRCLKMLMACRQLEIEHRENEQCPIILCGDLNSHPKSGLMKLLLNRYLDATNGMTWKHLCTYEWEDGSSIEYDGASPAGGQHQLHNVKAINLEFPPSFPKLMSAYSTPPEFTHFVEAFAGTLDYILMTENFEVVKSGPTPTREDVQKHVAMPNECMPSDHVSLVCDVKWK